MKRFVFPLAMIAYLMLSGLASYAQMCAELSATGNDPDAAARFAVFDRWGNVYDLEDIAIPQPEVGLPVPEAQQGCVTPRGLFELHFEDCFQGPTWQYGFNDQNEGQARRDVACQVFADIEALLDVSGSRTIAGSFFLRDTTHIEFARSGNNGSMGASVGGASSYQLAPVGMQGGFIDDAVWNTLRSGVDYFRFLPPGYLPPKARPTSTGAGPPAFGTTAGRFYHGTIIMNFD